MDALSDTNSLVLYLRKKKQTWKEKTKTTHAT